jgi:hypothetical protein
MAIPREIIDNSEDNKLLTFLRDFLGEHKNGNCDIATAFFNIQANAMVKDELNGLKKFSLLLGKAPEIESEYTLGDGLLKAVKEEIENFDLKKDKELLMKDFIQFLKKENVRVRLFNKLV